MVDFRQKNSGSDLNSCSSSSRPVRHVPPDVLRLGFRRQISRSQSVTSSFRPTLIPTATPHDRQNIIDKSEWTLVSADFDADFDAGIDSNTGRLSLSTFSRRTPARVSTLARALRGRFDMLLLTCFDLGFGGGSCGRGW